MLINLLDNLDLEIPENNIGVLVSGGVDSSLLLYFLLKYSQNKVHIFSLASRNKFSTNIKHSINVIHKCAELTDNYNFTHHINYAIEQNKTNLFELPKMYLDKKEIDCCFTGVTKNPPSEVLSNFGSPSTEDDERNPEVVRNVIHRKWHTPWTNIDKKDLYTLYKKYNLLDTLFPITRSCESLEQQYLGAHCGTCWWCKERLWGFGKLV